MREPGSDAFQRFSPQRLAWVTNTLLLVFIITISDAAIPARLLDLNWQIDLISSLLNLAIFPLIGLALLHLAADLDPDDERLQRRRRRLARLSVLVSLGFLLLILLQPLLLWQRAILIEQQQLTPLRRSEQSISNIRSTLQQSRSTVEIFENLKALKAPPTPEFYASLPLSELRQRMGADLVNAERELRSLRQQNQAIIQRGRRAFIRMTLRNSLLTLAYGLGFAALAQRRRDRWPLLLEWQDALNERMAWVGTLNRPSANTAQAQMERYVEEISSIDDDCNNPTQH